MIPIYTDFTRDFRAHLGDTEVSGGQLWTDASGKCDTYLQQAYSELYKGFEGAGVENIQRTVYGVVPPFTSYISPANFGASNFSEPVQRPLWERGVDTSQFVFGASASTDSANQPVVVISTALPHGFTSGQMVMISGATGISDNVNDIWSIEVTSPTTFSLKGCLTTGAYNSNSGTVSTSNENWSEVHPVAEIKDYPQPGGTLSNYQWVNGAFRVFPASVQRAIRMMFYLSGRAPTNATPTASLGFDDSLGFLSYRAAALASKDRGYKGTFEALNATALGPTARHEDWGGLYGLLMRSKARSAGRNPVVVSGFRNSRRNAGLINRY